MKQCKPFKSIVLMWPSRRELARDLGVSLSTVHHWVERDSIPAKYDAALLDAASARNLPLNWRDIMDSRSVVAFQRGDSARSIQGESAHKIASGDVA